MSQRLKKSSETNSKESLVRIKITGVSPVFLYQIIDIFDLIRYNKSEQLICTGGLL